MAPEHQLMERYCDGDAAAFQELYRLVAPRILGYLLRMARERHLAEDLLQMTFLKIHRARSAYVRGAEPMPWIYAIAHRTFLDEMRKRQRARVTFSHGDDVPEQAARIDGQAVDAYDEPRHDSELAQAALAALAQLPEKQREAVVLTKLDGKSIAEAAAITGATPGAMKVRAHRGYEALRKALAAIGVS
jgi:RNA polymerase sigma-70 factor (ECF subfamily)